MGVVEYKQYLSSLIVRGVKPVARDTVVCVLAQIGHDEPTDSTQESAELPVRSLARKFPYDSAETCVSPNFVLAFNQARRRIAHYSKR